MAKTVRDIMTESPRTVTRSTSIVEAAQLMEREDVGSLPVVDEGGFLVGIVTDRDITVRAVGAGRDVRSTTVGEIFTDKPTCAWPDEPLDEALDLMTYRQVRRLPVVEDDQLVGIVALADVVHEVKGKKAARLVDEICQPAREHAHV